MEPLRDDVQSVKDVKGARQIPSGFTDLNDKKHHVLDLYEYYKDSGKKEACPIYKCFQKFISDWESELKSLTS
jgi:hypothetical protein